MENILSKKIHIVILLLLTFCLNACESEFLHQYIIYSQDIQPKSESWVIIKSVLADRPLGGEIKSHGYCWSVNPSPTISNDTSMLSGEIVEGKFKGSLKGLIAGKQYYAKAYAVDQTGFVHYGNELKFLNNFTPSFTITRLNAITDTYFEIFSELTLMGNDTILEYGHVWSKTELPTVADARSISGKNLTTDQINFTFTTQLSSLQKNSKYYVRAYIANKWGVFYGSQITITVPEKILAGQWIEVNFPNTRQSAEFNWLILKGNSDLYFFTSFEDPFSNYLGSNRCAKIDLTSNQVDSIESFPGVYREHVKGFFVNDKAYVGFGSGNYFSGSNYYYDMWIYTPETDSWTPGKNLPTMGTDVLFSTDNGGYGFVGVKNGANLELWRYAPTTDSWLKLVSNISISPDSDVGSAISIGNYLYFSVGSNYNNYNNTIVRFNPITNSWEKIGDFMAFLFFTYNDNVYAVNFGLKVFKLDATNNSWIERASVISNKIYPPYTAFSMHMNGEAIIGLNQGIEYYERIPDQSLWFKYTER